MARLLARNFDRTSLINVYNSSDRILGFVWQLMQIEEKSNNDPKAVAVARAATTLGLNTAGFFAALNSGAFLGTDFILNPTLQANDSRAQTFWGGPFQSFGTRYS